MQAGAFPGYTIETLDNVRYFTLGSLAELDAKWPLIRAQNDDFIKVYLWNTDGIEFPPGVLPPPMVGKTALMPEVFEEIVRRAHAEGRRVSAHVTTAGDFGVAGAGARTSWPTSRRSARSRLRMRRRARRAACPWR